MNFNDLIEDINAGEYNDWQEDYLECLLEVQQDAKPLQIVKDFLWCRNKEEEEQKREDAKELKPFCDVCDKFVKGYKDKNNVKDNPYCEHCGNIILISKKE